MIPQLSLSSKNLAWGQQSPWEARAEIPIYEREV